MKKKILYLATLLTLLMTLQTSLNAAWNVTYQIPQNDLEDLFFLADNNNIGYAVGSNTTIFKTTDAGSSWTSLTVGISGFSADFNAVWFTDSNTGYVGGDDGALIKTTNAGGSWTQISIGQSNKNIEDIFFYNNDYGIFVGENGLIIYTTNAGITWNEKSSSITTDLNALYMYTTHSGFAVGDNGKIFETHSFGQMWNELLLPFPVIDYNGITMQGGHIVLVCGSDGNIIKSTNQGTDWFMISQAETNEDLYDVAFSTLNTVFVTGDNGVIMKSNDIGATWSINDINTNDNFKSIKFITEEIGYSVGTDGSLARTTNGGDGITKSIIVTSPGDSTNWIKGSIQSITWEASQVSDFILSYSIDAGATWNIIDTVYDNEHSYQWNVPNIISDYCKIKITDYSDMTFYAYSNGLFSISSPNIKLYSPNGGERWNMKSMHEITWDSDDIDSVKIEYTLDGENWNLDTNSIYAKNGLRMNWQVPDTPSVRCLVRITDIDNEYDFDVSDNYFAIAGIILTSFNDGANYLYNSEYTITWNSVLVKNIRIMYSIDNGNNWEIIENSFPASGGEYTWSLPNTPSDKCLVRIMDTENSIFTDQSDETFSISGLTLTTPLGGETWISGTEHNIIWQSTDIDRVNIEYTNDDGLTWITIISNRDASTGTYTWKVPKTPGYKCKIKITNVDNPSIYDISNEFFTISGTGVFLIEPNGGELYEVGSMMRISWASASASMINLKYSTDAGKTWNKIVDSIDVNSLHFDWTIPNDSNLVHPSTECLIKVEDTDNIEISDMSDDYFRIRNFTTYYKTPESWDFTSETGENSIVIVPTSINPMIDGKPFETGDAVGVFYNNGGNLKCAGYSIWHGHNMSITVWSDDPQTTEKDGFAISEEYIVMLWDSDEGKEYMAEVEYSSGFPYYTNDGISIVSSFDTHKSLDIILNKGWNIISSNIIPSQQDIDIVMYEVLNNMEFMKDENADLYYPDESLNTIQTWDIELGYQIYMNEADTLKIRGVQAVPAEHTKFLEALRWYIVSYLPDGPITADNAMISLDTNLLMVKNSAGQIYYPDYGINLIGNMLPSQGYKVITYRDDTLEYPENTPKIAKNTDKTQSQTDYKYFDFTEANSGNTAVIVLESDLLTQGSEVAALTSEGKICGAAKVVNNTAVIVIWGDNPKTSAIEGAGMGEKISFKLFSDSGEHAIRLNKAQNVISGIEVNQVFYYEDAILNSDSIELIISTVNENNYDVRIHPQPASDYLTIEADFEINKVALLSLKGEVLQLNHYHGFNYTVDLKTNKLSSGTYILIIHSRNHSISKKVIINK